MKKKITLLTLLTGFALVSFAQGPPAKVEDAFKVKFSKATSIEWEKENEKEWEAEFKMNGVNYSANFSNEGTWKETEHKIKTEDLPEAVKHTLASEFKGYETKKSEMVETPKFTGYEVRVVKGDESIELVMDKEGKVLKKK
jgi:hypothetical protein